MKMTVKEAFAYVEAVRIAYNKACPEDQLNLMGAYDMISECCFQVGTEKDRACLEAIRKKVAKARVRAEIQLFRDQTRSVESKLVQKFLKQGFDYS
jgi:hypothetical protein